MNGAKVRKSIETAISNFLPDREVMPTRLCIRNVVDSLETILLRTSKRIMYCFPLTVHSKGRRLFFDDIDRTSFSSSTLVGPVGR